MIIEKLKEAKNKKVNEREIVAINLAINLIEFEMDSKKRDLSIEEEATLVLNWINSFTSGVEYLEEKIKKNIATDSEKNKYTEYKEIKEIIQEFIPKDFKHLLK